jgi:hypothetical protein
MKVTLIIEDSGGGLEISGSGASFGGTSGAQQYRGSTGASAAERSAGAYDGGAAASVAGSSSGAGPAQFMGQNVEPSTAVSGSTDMAAGAAPGAARMNDAMSVDQSSDTYADVPEAGGGARRRRPQRKRTRGTRKRAK